MKMNREGLHCLPHPRSCIGARRCDARSIRRPGNVEHQVGTAPVGKLKPAGGSIPDLNCYVAADRGDTLAIGGPGHAKYYFRVSLVEWTGKRFRENSQSHHTPPVTSANVTHAPVWTEREIATSARSAATPSSTLAPCRGVPYRIVSAKPSSCSR